MYKKNLTFLLLLLSLIPFSFAQEQPSETIKTDPTTQLSLTAGITPDSNFYFVEDKILSQFRGDLENREKKIAEMREMVKEGKIDEAKISLSRYRNYADNVEKNVEPQDKEEAQRSSAAIKNTLKEIEDDVPQEDQNEFINDINEQEDDIATAAELASKIKELCETLSKLDPEQYALTCKTKEDAPKWQKELDIELTKEQETEAEAFFTIMSDCFKNPQNCACDKITVKAFAEECKIVAPLASKCEQGDESACTQMDSRKDPRELLPIHLQHVFDKLENSYSEAEFENHFPSECREKGATTKEACMKIMFEENAPEECIQALNAGKIDLKNERAARMQCEEIMFLENAPEECVQAGIKDHKECGKYMFKQNAPEECIQAGLTGERGSDNKKCEQIMKGKRGQEGSQNSQGFGKNCMEINDKEEKLKCFEDMFTNNRPRERQEFDDDEFNQGRDNEEFRKNMRMPPPCEEAGATSPQECRKIMDQEGRDREQQFRENRREDEQFKSPCSSPEECQQFNREGRREEFHPPTPDQSPSGDNQLREEPSQEFNRPPSTQESPSSGSSPEPSHEEQAPAESAPSVTGSVVFDVKGNGFLSYYFR